MKKTSSQINVIICCLILIVIIGCKDSSSGRYRISNDRSMESCILENGLTIIKYIYKDAILYESHSEDRIIYKLVKSHWNPPSLESYTGDIIDEIYLESIEKINYDEKSNIVFGVGLATSENNEDKRVYFIYCNETFLEYNSKDEMMDHLKSLQINDNILYDPRELIDKYK